MPVVFTTISVILFFLEVNPAVSEFLSVILRFLGISSPQYLDQSHWTHLVISIIPLFIAMLVSYYYGITRRSTIEILVKESLENAVIEFKTVEKMIPITFGLYVVPFSIVLLVLGLFYYKNPSTLQQQETFYNFFYIAIIGLQFMYIWLSNFAMYIEVILLDVILKKEFRLYLVKACFTIAVNKRDSLEYLYYFSLGLQEYNKYLKRRLNYEIKDIDKIFSKVSLLDYDARIGIVRSLSNSFEPEADRLKPLK
jgi:ABC-type proline/glycine betaine transport system permease subunit